MKSIRKMRVVLIAALVLVAMGAASAVAQGAGDQIERRTVISTNPLLFVFGWYTAEIEVRVSDRTTLSLSGSVFTTEEDFTDDTGLETGTDLKVEETYYSGTLSARYYPTEAFKGFFIGGRLGWYHVEEEDPVFGKSEGEFAGAGIDVGYGWLLGEPQRIAVSVGIGAVRLFGGDLEDVQATLPTIRFINVGFAF
jgi:hypothetical protein